MEVLTVIIAIILFVAICVGAWTDNAGLSVAAGALILVYIFGIYAGSSLGRDQPVVIKKSSDTEWEIHTGEPKIYQDTVISRVVVINGDTLLPTTEYRVLWRDSK